MQCRVSVCAADEDNKSLDQGGHRKMLDVGRKTTSVLMQLVPGASACVLLVVLRRQANSDVSKHGSRAFLAFPENVVLFVLSQSVLLHCGIEYLGTPLLLGVYLGAVVITPVRSVRSLYVCFDNKMHWQTRHVAIACLICFIMTEFTLSTCTAIGLGTQKRRQLEMLSIFKTNPFATLLRAVESMALTVFDLYNHYTRIDQRGPDSATAKYLYAGVAVDTSITTPGTQRAASFPPLCLLCPGSVQQSAHEMG